MTRSNGVIVALLLLLTCSRAAAQVVTADPLFPVASSPVTITFHADQGDTGLKDYTGDDLYAHTGVITAASSSPSDWKYVVAGWSENIPRAKLTRISANSYTLEITPSIREYYGVPDDEQIMRLAFVFRNANGSRTGRATGGFDIFYDVAEEASFELRLLKPALYTSLVDEGELITVEAAATVADSVILYHNGAVVKKVTGATLSHTFTATGAGSSLLLARAWHNNVMKADSAWYFIRTEPVTAPHPAGLRPGVNITSEGSAAFLLYAPGKGNIFVLGDFNGWAHSSEGFMRRTPGGEWFWLEVTGLHPDEEYGFQYLIDEEIRIPDPYAEKVLDPWNDRYIEQETYPDLKPYPEGLAENLVSVFRTREDQYEWRYNNFVVPAADTLVIYEMLVRDFTEKHSFRAVRDTLDYLKRLGINAIELMPVNEFEGNNSWGYNPAMYFAVDKYYGTPNELKELIDSCHGRGIAVIMDMVLNHAYGSNPLVRMYWNSSTGRPAADNPWFNESSPNTSYSWGYDFNHESSATRAFADSVCRYWIEEFRVDGYRFDFTKGFTNRPGDGWAYDASRIAILKRLGERIWSYRPDAILILEHFTDNNEEKELADNGFLLWGNSWGRYQAASTSRSEWNMSLADASWRNRGWNQPGIVDYMESHDEERIMWLNLNQGESVGGYNIRELTNALKRIKLTATFFMTMPGPKMLWQFQELGYDYGRNYNNDPLGPRPVRWDYLDVPARRNLYDNFSALIRLKKREPAFSSDNFTLYESGETKRLNIEHPDMDVVVMGNFDIFPREVSPSFTRNGTWYEFFRGTALDVGSGNRETPILLQPGEYRLYTSARVERPSFLLGVEGPAAAEEGILSMEVFPSPFAEQATVRFSSSAGVTPHTLELFTSDGSVVRMMTLPGDAGEVTLYGDGLPPGIYYLRATADRATADRANAVVRVVKR